MSTVSSRTTIAPSFEEWLAARLLELDDENKRLRREVVTGTLDWATA